LIGNRNDATILLWRELRLEIKMPEENDQSSTRIWIADRRFMHELGRLKALRNFVIQEGIALNSDKSDVLAFGNLNMLEQVPGWLPSFIRGRAATRSEWDQLERQTEVIYRLMDENQRRKFNLGIVPWWIAWTPAIGAILAANLLVLAIVAVGLSIQLPDNHPMRTSIAATALLCYSVWLMVLGAVGSTAFIGMNVLSVQEDVTFDLTNRRLMVMRIVLGALFALILTLPFGFPGFVEFCKEIAKIGAAGAIDTGGKPDPSVLSQQAVLLLLPFILGFSTSLVIMILNQFIEGVQAFFGRKSSDRKPSAAAEAVGLPPPPSPAASTSAPFKM
jgi:hypothetical protein